jgi:hypothetical protein
MRTLWINGFPIKQYFLVSLSQNALCCLSGSEHCCYRTFHLINNDTCSCIICLLKYGSHWSLSQPFLLQIYSGLRTINDMTRRRKLWRLDMISKPANLQKFMKVFILYTLYTSFFFFGHSCRQGGTLQRTDISNYYRTNARI